MSIWRVYEADSYLPHAPSRLLSFMISFQSITNMSLAATLPLPPLTRVATALLGLACTAAGVRSIVHPGAFAESFGLSLRPLLLSSSLDPRLPDLDTITRSLEHQPSPDTKSILNSESQVENIAEPSSQVHPQPQAQVTTLNPFIPVVGVRNIATGLSLLAFSLTNDPSTIGILLLCNLVSMLGDTLICYRYRAWDADATKGPDGVKAHLITSLVVGFLGSYMALQ